MSLRLGTSRIIFSNTSEAEAEFSALISIATSYRHLCQIQAKLFTFGLHRSSNIAVKLLNLSSSVSPTAYLGLLFRHLSRPTICVWNAFIRALSKNDLPREAMITFTHLKDAQIKPDNFTFPSVLKACASLPGDASFGYSVHGEVIRRGLQDDMFILSSLIHMYSNHWCLDGAAKLFDRGLVKDVVSWNCMVAGFFRREDVRRGRSFFEQMPERNVVSWNTVITGYAQIGLGVEALKLFRRMQLEGMRPNEGTIVGVLRACADVGALDIGKWVHRYVELNITTVSPKVSNCLIDMYAKGGSLIDARRVFDSMENRSVISWNCMIGGFAVHGYGKEAIQLFEEMKMEGTKPNDITFIGVLSACAHSGLIKEGKLYFSRMEEDHGIAPKVEHYGCMVDLLGRGGCTVEAHKVIKSMPVVPDAGIWGALLGACCNHGDLDMAETAAIHLLELEPWNSGNYVLLSNIYAAQGYSGKAKLLRENMKGKLVRKTPGSSSIEVGCSVYEFISGDRFHPQSEHIYAKLEELGVSLRLAGYVPETGSVLQDICEEEKEHLLGVHSERIAIAFGLISTTPGVPLRIVKNLRICRDCHSAIKLGSELISRHIIIRDRVRFHHFSDDSCSCKDYW